MTELRTDPSERRPPPAGAREKVMRDGLRRRRVAFAGAGSAMAVAVLAAAALLTGTTAQSDSLRVDQPAGGTRVLGIDPAAGAQAKANSSAVQQMPGSTTAQPQAAGSGPVPALAAPHPSAQATRSPAAHSGREPMTRRPTQQVCPGNGFGVDTGGAVFSGNWCLYLTTPGQRDPASSAKLGLTICRNPATGRGALNFATTQEADFIISVSQTKKKLWQWSSGRRFTSDRHVLMVGGTDCYVWETGWDWRDEQGRPVGSGLTLRLTAESAAKELKSQTASTTFTS